MYFPWFKIYQRSAIFPPFLKKTHLQLSIGSALIHNCSLSEHWMDCCIILLLFRNFDSSEYMFFLGAPLDHLYYFMAHIKCISVATLGWTEFSEYRILQEEQKTNTAPFWATLKLNYILLCISIPMMYLNVMKGHS